MSNAFKLPPTMRVPHSDRPLRIAVVYGRCPLPMRRADQLTVAHLLAFLKARGHAVDLYAINTGGKPDAEELQWLADKCRTVRLYDHGKLNQARGLLMTLTGKPAQVALFSHARQRADLAKAVSLGAYDLIYTYYFRSAEVTRNLVDLKSSDRAATFLAMQLSQTLNTRRIAANAPNLAYRAFYSVESKLVARYEAQIWQHFDRTVLIGLSDVAAINEVCRKRGMPPLDNVVLCAHGVDTERFRSIGNIATVPGKLVFSGVMRTPTNVHAVQWFVRQVWPLIRAEVPGAHFDIVGREPSAEVKALGDVPGVTVVGTVPDTSVPIASAAICINSIQAGGGMQNKLIEYMSSEKAVVATSVANEGIGATPGEHLLIADDPKAFAQEVIGLLRDDARREALGLAARQFILDHWTWEAHFLKLESAFYEAIDEVAADLNLR